MSRPKVILNFAMSVDGKVSTKRYQPSDFSSRDDKRRLLEIRSLGDALLVGRNTGAIDNMSMGQCRQIGISLLILARAMISAGFWRFVRSATRFSSVATLLRSITCRWDFPIRLCAMRELVAASASIH